MGRFGLGVLALLILVALLAPVLAPFDPSEQHAGEELLPPGSRYVLGTDQFGRDLLSRVIFGSQVSLLVGGLVVGLGAGIGIPTGLLAGYFGGFLGASIMRLYDVILSFPAILLGVAVVSVLGPGTLNVSFAVAIALMPNFALLTRSSVLSEREKEYVQAARSVGSTDARIVFRHILPNSMAPLLVQLSLGMGFAVLAEATLSFLGLGTQPPQPSWGNMLNESRSYLRDSPWPGVWPGMALATLLISLNYLSDTLRDALDPRTYR